jgi:hypothetical protein
MREFLSQFSFWGLCFLLTALILFVIIYLYKKKPDKVQNKDVVDHLRRCATSVYLAAESSAAEDISTTLRAGATEIERLRTKNSVMFWIIIAMNMVMTSILALGYAIF